MYNIKIKYTHLALITTIIGNLITLVLLYFTNFKINIQIPLLLVGAFSLSLIINVIIYLKASTIQSLKLTLSTLVLFIINILLIKLGIDGLNFKGFTITPDFNMVINPLILALSLIIASITLSTLIKLEKIKIKCVCKIDDVKENLPPQEAKTENKNLEQQKSKTLPVINEIEEEKIPLEIKIEEEPLIKFDTQVDPVIKEEIIINEPKIPLNTINHNIADTDDSLFDEVISYSCPIPESKQLETTYESNQDLFETPIGNLPDILFEEPTELKEENKTPPEIMAKLVNENFQYIPENVRLVENQEAKPSEAGGIISSIGKLLVNQRDIENIIEINSVIQQVSDDKDGTNIITKIIGEKINEKLQKIEAEYYQIRDLTLSNKAGFAISSVIKNQKRQHTVGALASGAFLTIENYLTRLQVNKPEKIFFESENLVNSLLKVDNFIFYFCSDKDFPLVDSLMINNVISKTNITSDDLEKLKKTDGVIEAAITTLEGELLSAINIEECETLAAISSAIFENLKIFIKNIQPEKLSKITIFSENKVLTIKNYDSKVLALLTTTNGPISLNKNSSKIQNLIT